MTDTQERRAHGVNRVTVARAVDICGRDANVPAFEAESVELSGRGMHVRTPFLPPLGAPLVCRLDDGGREIVVEGVVAWQKHHDGGGEFGIQFTALDSGSVEALKDLCGLRESGRAAPPTAKAGAPAASSFSSSSSGSEPAPNGAPVKLHIEGLGAPMKARVREGTSRRMQVGSNLEFLKVGRGLEVEDVEQGERRGAHIDAVSIAIDPKTQVPQLVVVLRYDGQETTPEPTVVGAGSDAGDEVDAAAASAKADKASVESARAALDDGDDEGEVQLEVSAGDGDSGDSSDDDDDAAAFRGRVDAMAVKVGKAMQDAGKKFASGGGTVATRFAAWAKTSGAKLAERSAAPRRTAPAPISTTSSGPRKLRPQNGPSAPEETGLGRKKKMLIGVGAGTFLTVTVAALAFSGGKKPADGAAADAKTGAAVPTDVITASAPQAAAAPGAAMPAMAGAAQAAAPAMPAQPNGAGQAQATNGVIANVPLFGPTPMATLEPAPLGPTPEELAKAGVPMGAGGGEERMDAEDDEKSQASKDESFDDDSKSSKKADKDKGDKGDKGDKDEVKPEDVKPWINGTMHLPVVHRVKLDKPGAAIKGVAESKGFSVIIPGRKAEGGVSAIAKRDDRIASVKSQNGNPGVKITFAFRGKVPGYKVRLRGNYVEFFVSSPDGAK